MKPDHKPASPFSLNSISGAVLSADQAYRYWLWRIWDRSLPLLVVCMFNPSTADHRKDDQTIGRCCHFAKAWGYGGILVINLWALRSSEPSMVRSVDPEDAWGDAQPQAWANAIEIARRQETPILAAWGNLGLEDDFNPFLDAADGVPLICLGTTESGMPKHPMARGKHRVPDRQQPIDLVLA